MSTETMTGNLALDILLGFLSIPALLFAGLIFVGIFEALCDAEGWVGAVSSGAAIAFVVCALAVAGAH